MNDSSLGRDGATLASSIKQLILFIIFLRNLTQPNGPKILPTMKIQAGRPHEARGNSANALSQQRGQCPRQSAPVRLLRGEGAHQLSASGTRTPSSPSRSKRRLWDLRARKALEDPPMQQ